ncbi:hypothetical protein GGS24DRAFT_493210 [Hypoxylon argillaceum]|nr:hypothetical protein GGS24DRAFT_493210 [Hypoxylon argillaceum]
MDILPHKRYRSMKGAVLFKAPNAEHGITGRNSGIAGGCLKEARLDQHALPTCPVNANTSTNSHDALVIPAHAAKLIASCTQNAIGEVQDLAATTPAKEAKHVSVLQALVNAKAFQDAFELVPREHHSTLGALFQGIESMEAAPLLAQTTEPGRPESEPGVGLLEYAVDEFDGDQAFLQDGYVAVIDEIAKPPWWNDEPYSSIIKKGLIETETQGEDDFPDSFLGFTSELSGVSIGRNGSVSPDVFRLPVMNFHTLTGQPVLCAFVSCKTATTVEGVKDEDISALFHRTLTQWFGAEPPRPDATRTALTTVGADDGRTS